MNIQNVYILDDRGIIYVHGVDVKEFLQNLITNNIDYVDKNNSCFASLLTPQGKYLYDFIIIEHKNGYIIDCEKELVEGLIKQLNLYKLRSKIEILNLSNEFVVAAFSQERFMQFDEAKNQSGYTIRYRDDPILLDPRNKKLGGRLIINLEKLYLSLKRMDLKSSETKKYYSFTHELGIPQKNMKKLQNKIFGIECNFDELNGIDFKKGCYVGQENTARIKLKDKLTKRLFPIQLVKGTLVEGGSIHDNQHEIGKILINNLYPFGLIKYTNEYFNENIEYKSENALLKIKKPDWIY
jgi:hypothetical protein